MGKKSGKACNVVLPAAPDKAEDADKADPGEVEQAKAEQRKTQSGKYGSAKVKPHQPPQTADQKKEKASWIEIELVGEDNQPIPGEKYRITLPDGSVAEGTLDEKGLARVEGFENGTCKVCFPELDQDAWEDGAGKSAEAEGAESPKGGGDPFKDDDLEFVDSSEDKGDND
jgi:protein-disulfide isomerase